MTRFRFVEAEAAQFPVSLLCRVVGVTVRASTPGSGGRRAHASSPTASSPSGSARSTPRRGDLRGAADPLRAEARRRHPVGKKRVARLMRQLGLRGADGKRGGPRTTVRDPKRPAAPDLVDRDFARAEPNRLWVCDLKYIQTGQGFLFLAVVQDVFSRRIIGWSMRDDLKAELVLDALGMAVSVRGGDAAGVVRIRITGRSTPASSTAPTPSSPGSTSRWARSATPGTTPSPRPSSPASRKNCCAASASHPRAGPTQGLLVHRVLLQPPPQALQPRHAQPDRLRTPTPTGGHRGLTSGVNGNG